MNDATARDTLRKIAAEHYGPQLADLVRATVARGGLPSAQWVRDAKALLAKIDEGKVSE
jgi:hypothetical protein